VQHLRHLPVERGAEIHRLVARQQQPEDVDMHDHDVEGGEEHERDPEGREPVADGHQKPW
jgi:hypothetical protein